MPHLLRGATYNNYVEIIPFLPLKIFFKKLLCKPSIRSSFFYFVYVGLTETTKKLDERTY